MSRREQALNHLLLIRRADSNRRLTDPPKLFGQQIFIGDLCQVPNCLFEQRHCGLNFRRRDELPRTCQIATEALEVVDIVGRQVSRPCGIRCGLGRTRTGNFEGMQLELDFQRLAGLAVKQLADTVGSVTGGVLLEDRSQPAQSRFHQRPQLSIFVADGAFHVGHWLMPRPGSQETRARSS